ncbi:MAG: bifunctional UDP-N-acetylmuramoyl-tripeptide:D-alanyl-D-alanine ligase/alanine racemase [Bacteroidia bacterium]|nr:bifunctional UDP-N-acetylmuramoyl-tripeptide:D-alanyl-D-alanine ligase/alanine racemase [Bacteroidia bacterium]
MFPYTLKDIFEVVGGRMVGAKDVPTNVIRFLSFDSRTILAGKETLFFALKSDRNNGHRFIQDAVGREVTMFVVEELPENLQSDQHIQFIVVGDALVALQKLAAFHRARFDYPVVGITGSNGKTIVKEWLSEILSPENKIVRSPRSYNSQIGNPLSVWLMDDRFDLAIFEAGISLPGEMERLEAIIRPNHGIFTHLGKAHLENFSSVKELVQEKIKLFRNSTLIVYCCDIELLEDSLKTAEFRNSPRFFRWSESDPSANLQIISKQKNEEFTEIIGIFESEEVRIEIPFFDDASIENAIHCWAYALAIGRSTNLLADRFRKITPIAMRLELKKGINGCMIINDSYNSDTASLVNALDFIFQQSDSKNKKCTVIISDILQSGENSSSLYREIADYIEMRKIHRMIGIGPEISQYSNIFNVPEKVFYSSADEFILHFQEGDFNHEVILLKGARSYRFDRISSLLQEKAHQTVMEIDLDAMVYNLNYYRSKLTSGTKIMAMVKAFSYGTGSIEVAKVLQYQKIDFLAVAIADEGIELRNNGIDVPIVVMNPEEHSFDAMIENRLEPNIYRFELLEKFDAALSRNAVNNFPIHLKMDTGMKRLGFDNAAEVEKVAHYILARNTMYIRSVFSHLAVSDDSSNDLFTRAQFSQFLRYCDIVTNLFAYKILRHISNSSGIERFPDLELDMVRLGIGLYGASANLQDVLHNVATLKTTISQIRTVAAGETVGYGRRGISDQLMTIAVLPIGYADGLNRRLSNGVGKVVISGVKVPIIGTVCMDMCMVDITGVKAQEGDRAIIFGEELPVTEVAATLGTISYEILTSIGQRVKRIYFKE